MAFDRGTRRQILKAEKKYSDACGKCLKPYEDYEHTSTGKLGGKIITACSKCAPGLDSYLAIGVFTPHDFDKKKVGAALSSHPLYKALP